MVLSHRQDWYDAGRPQLVRVDGSDGGGAYSDFTHRLGPFAGEIVRSHGGPDLQRRLRRNDFTSRRRQRTAFGGRDTTGDSGSAKETVEAERDDISAAVKSSHEVGNDSDRRPAVERGLSPQRGAGVTVAAAPGRRQNTGSQAWTPSRDEIYRERCRRTCPGDGKPMAVGLDRELPDQPAPSSPATNDDISTAAAETIWSGRIRNTIDGGATAKHCASARLRHPRPGSRPLATPPRGAGAELTPRARNARARRRPYDRDAFHRDRRGGQRHAHRRRGRRRAHATASTCRRYRHRLLGFRCTAISATRPATTYWRGLRATDTAQFTLTPGGALPPSDGANLPSSAPRRRPDSGGRTVTVGAKARRDSHRTLTMSSISLAIHNGPSLRRHADGVVVHGMSGRDRLRRCR